MANDYLQNDLIYSLKRHLEESGYNAKVKYDGMRISDFEKPFVVIEALSTTTDLIAAQRLDIEYGLLYQITIHARNSDEMRTMTQQISNDLWRKITYYSLETGAPIATGFFYADVTESETIPAGDDERLVEYHRTFLTVEIEINYELISGDFTQ